MAILLPSARFWALRSFILIGKPIPFRIARPCHPSKAPVTGKTLVNAMSQVAGAWSRGLAMKRAPIPRSNHYEVVTLDRAGHELYGWDYKSLRVARIFAEKLCGKALRVEIWARDRFGNRLARLFPSPRDI
jgi:hypothetical protein